MNRKSDTALVFSIVEGISKYNFNKIFLTKGHEVYVILSLLNQIV